MGNLLKQKVGFFFLNTCRNGLREHSVKYRFYGFTKSGL